MTAPQRPARSPSPSAPAASARRLAGDEAASAAVQFALVLPIFLGLVLGIMDMSRLMWTQASISRAAKTGARYAMVRGAESASPASADDVAAEVRGRLAGLDPDDAGVDVTWTPDNAPGSTVTIQVSYPFAFTGLSLAGLESIPLGASAATIISQ